MQIAFFEQWQASQATQANAMLSPQGAFRRNIQNHSTPLNANGATSFNRINGSNKKRAKKRKLVDSSHEVIDLTPKRSKVPSTDSDVEIIEPEPPTIIDLVADETHGCAALMTAVNAPADIDTTSDNQENANSNCNHSTNNDVSVIVDSFESIESLGLVTMEESQVSEANIEPNIEPVPLYVKDSSGGGSLKPPLYDLVSDDSFCFDSPFATPISSQDFSQSKTLTNVDDSVVFVSETINVPKVQVVTRAADFITINPNNRYGFNRMLRNSRTSPKGKVQKRRQPSPKNTVANKVNRSPPKQQPSPVSKPISGIKRMVLIDGNNVAYSHSRNVSFSVEGIDICLKYFLEKGYDAKAIVPQMRLKKTKSSNQDLLAKLESEGKVVFSPCKNLPNGKKVTSYDDRFILDFAADYDAAVISNDNYRDLSKESEKYRDIINTRVIGFTFLNDIIRFPQDPYGKFGPSLTDILDGKEIK